MKRKIMLLLLLFGVVEVNARTTTDTFVRTFIGYYHYVDSNGKWGDFELFKRQSDQKLAYCIEPGIPFSGNVVMTGFGDLSNKELASHVHLTEDELREVSLIAYYGYGYGSHKQTSWFVAAQYKIWETLGRSTQFTSENEPSNPWEHVIPIPVEIENEMKEIESLVEAHKKKPSISLKHYVLNLHEEKKIEDDVLKNYHLVGNHDGVTLENGILTIHGQVSKKKTTITLERDYLAHSQAFMVYYNETEQNLLMIGNIPKDTITFTYEVQSGNLELEKIDEETGNCSSKGLASLENAIYTLYNQQHEKVTDIVIQHCKGNVDNLPVGTYTFQETTAPYGYDLDKTIYHVTISNDSTTKIQVKDKEKKIPLTITKKYLEEKNLEYPEEGAEFDIISVTTNQIVAHLKTDAEGKASILLPYDRYILVQTKGKENYHMSSNQNFAILNDEPVAIHLVNEPYTKKLKVEKVEKMTGKKIKLANIEFKLYDLQRKKYVCENQYCTFKTNELGEFEINDLYPSLYRLEEVKKKNEGLLWNSETITFEVTKNSPDELFITYENDSVIGELKIKKMDELGTPLQGVQFDLYAKENIYNVDHTIIYKKDEKIMTLITDEDGLASTIGLPLGQYYLKESSTLDEYLIDDNVYEFALKYKDEETPVISYTLELVNYKIPDTFLNDATELWDLYLGAIYEENEKHRPITAIH